MNGIVLPCVVICGEFLISEKMLRIFMEWAQGEEAFNVCDSKRSAHYKIQAKDDSKDPQS